MTTGTGPLGRIAVIVVEDDADLREEVVDFLENAGMDVRTADTGAVLDGLLAEAPADVIILDLGLPQEDGISIARRLRAQGASVGIIMMTARARVEERIFGYDIGADIYLVKPVDFGELVAAIRAVGRHRNGPPRDNEPPALAWRLDETSWRLAAPSGASTPLTRTEAQALLCLVEKPGTPVSRDEIARCMGKSTDLGEHRYVDKLISRLRHKIATQLGWEAPIGSAHGQGYYFAGPIVRGKK